MTNSLNTVETYRVGEALFKIKSSQAIFEYVNTPVIVTDKISKRGIAPWGENNDLPNQIIELIDTNPVASAAVEHKIDVAYGNGVEFGRMVKKTENSKPEFLAYTYDEIAANPQLKKVQDFFNNNNIDQQFAENISDLVWFSKSYVEFILNRDNPSKREITRYTSKEATYSRLEVANEKTGKIENHFYYAKWPESPEIDEIYTTPVIENSIDLEIEIGRRSQNNGTIKDFGKYRYVVPIALASPGKMYYPTPYYYSIIKSGWLDLGNAIPSYKKAYMQNTMSIKYIIEIDEKYFERVFHQENITELEKKKERKKKELDNINSYLKGVDAAGKSMVTYFKQTPDGKVLVPEINIKVLNNSQGGEFIEDSHEASAMTFIAFRTHPSLIGVIPGKTTSNLSGSDKRELLRISQSLQSRIRKAALQPLYIVKKINRWPEEIVFSVKDVILTSLDEGRETQEITTV